MAQMLMNRKLSLLVSRTCRRWGIGEQRHQWCDVAKTLPTAEARETRDPWGVPTETV